MFSCSTSLISPPDSAAVLVAFSCHFSRHSRCTSTVVFDDALPPLTLGLHRLLKPSRLTPQCGNERTKARLDVRPRDRFSTLVRNYVRKLWPFLGSTPYCGRECPAVPRSYGYG